MKIGIIGTGNIAEAMIKSFLKNRVVSSVDVMVYDIDERKLNYWAGTYDVMPCEDVEHVVQNSQILFLAVSGESLPKLIGSIDFMLRTHRPLVVSLARGVTLEEMEDMLEFIPPMARIITNLNIEENEGISAYCFNELVTDDLKATLIEMFSTTGQIIDIEERYFESFAAISALSSTFACSLIETLENCGVLDGLSRSMAQRVALQSVLGTARLLTNSDTDISGYISKLCPPRSMVIDALLELKSNSFDKAVISGYKAAQGNKK